MVALALYSAGSRPKARGGGGGGGGRGYPHPYIRRYPVSHKNVFNPSGHTLVQKGGEGLRAPGPEIMR